MPRDTPGAAAGTKVPTEQPGLPVARRRFDESTWQVAVVDAYR